jgi:hypothetical protein
VERIKEFNGLKARLLGLSLLGLGVVYASDFLSESRLENPIWEYDTYPSYELDWDKFTPFHHALAHSKLGVQEVMVLKLDEKRISGVNNMQGFHLSFQVAGHNRVFKSRVVVPRNDEIKILISNVPLFIRSLDSHDNGLPSILEGPFHRYDPILSKSRQM